MSGAKLKHAPETKRTLQVNDFICRRCRVQPTREDDGICGICKAIGKCAGPETLTWQDALFHTEGSREAYLWLKHRMPVYFRHPQKRREV